MADKENSSEAGDWTPRPDPTLLTTAQLRQEVGTLREILEARLDAMDKATSLLSESVNRTPTEIQKQIKNLRELQNQKFLGIELQFTERDVRTDQASKAAKEALDAALLAAKELVTAQNEANTAAAAKTESSFTKQIDQTATIILTLEKAIDSRINELKERLDRGEGSNIGIIQNQSERQTKNSFNVSITMMVLYAIALIISLSAIIISIYKK
jgi:hypothetical protein